MLRQAGLVVATRRGKRTSYRRDEANIARLLETLRDVF
ncbi:DNA-binding transcriptional regulator PaaX [Kribbella italica]|uniref:DNA-binding transcriptional regulator PaaX n=1 Tax=Kribbella italica TaxID=1540520 RepID=A0A7W9J0E4_9ACTN|nr:DNA-binding transcriptional regulator PaaX [Kribbella italica]